MLNKFSVNTSGNKKSSWKATSALSLLHSTKCHTAILIKHSKEASVLTLEKCKMLIGRICLVNGIVGIHQHHK